MRTLVTTFGPLVASMMIVVVFTGCPDPGEEELPPAAVAELEVLGVTPGVQFRQDGRVDFALLPFNRAGNVVLEGGMDVSIEILEMDPELGLPFPDTDVDDTDPVEPDARPLAFALDLDSSGSMADNDPDRLRVAAAQDFVEIVDEFRGDSMFGIFTFGTAVSDPFRDTLMLADFTDDTDVACDAIEQVVADGSTPLYGSSAEVLSYIDREIDPADTQRALVLFSDGQPDGDSATQDMVIRRADELAIPIFTVGLGPASQTSELASPSAVSVMQTLAHATGGVYAAATAAEDLSDTFVNLGTGLSSGYVVVTIFFEPAPPTGTWLSGVVSINGTETTWEFVAP